MFKPLYALLGRVLFVSHDELLRVVWFGNLEEIINIDFALLARNLIIVIIISVILGFHSILVESFKFINLS